MSTIRSNLCLSDRKEYRCREINLRTGSLSAVSFIAVVINMFRMGPAVPGDSIFFSNGHIIINLHHLHSALPDWRCFQCLMLLPIDPISSSIRWAQNKTSFDMSVLKKYRIPFWSKGNVILTNAISMNAGILFENQAGVWRFQFHGSHFWVWTCPGALRNCGGSRDPRSL